MITRRTILTLLAASPLALSATSARASTAPVFSYDGVALRGADPVAFFQEDTHRIGSADFTADWNGAIWHFISAANRDTFVADPDRYAPQYGGYCAFAMSRGAIASSVPEAWTIHEDKLYLNYSVEVRTMWRRDIAGNNALADQHWPGILA